MVTAEEIRNRRKQGKSIRNLALMKQHQDWVKMHTDLRLDDGPSQPMTAFLKMVSGQIGPEKYKVFLSLLRAPLPSTVVTGVIFDRLSRVYEGRNPLFHYQFKMKDYADDWEWYRQEVLHEPSVWRNKGWEYFKTEPNSMIVVDMPAEGTTDTSDPYPQPYFYWVTVDRIVDYATDDNGNVLWVIYKDDEKRKVYVVDDECYRVYDYDGEHGLGAFNGSSAIGNMDNPAVINYHNLGYCPAAFYLETPVSLSEPDVKRSPITSVLSELDWYLFFATSKKHLDTYGSYPIYSGMEVACDYEEELTIDERKQFIHCDHGVMVDESNHVIMKEGAPMRCPRCGDHQIAGPGSYVTYPAPAEGQPDMRNPVQILMVDDKALKFNSEEMVRKKNAIITACVGVEQDGISQFGASDKQIDASYESSGTILIRTKKELEHAQAFVDKTCCLLRYGDGFEGLDINYGTEFYSTDSSRVRKLYQQAKEGGAPEYDLMALQSQVMMTEYRNDQLALQRMHLLSEVEPLVSMSREEALKALEKGLVDRDDVMIKVNFESLIRRFERENGSIINFGLDMSGNKTEREMFRDRVNIVKQILKTYVREFEPLDPDPARV